MPSRHPYTVTNSYKGGFFMRTYGRNVRRAWDGDDYRAPKRQRLDDGKQSHAFLPFNGGSNENATYAYDLEDTLERAIRETSVAALSSSPSRKNSTIFSMTESMGEPEAATTITPPSSPPPELQVTPPNSKARKPTFSMFDKKKQKEKEKMKQSKHKTELGHENPSTISRWEDAGQLQDAVSMNVHALSDLESISSRTADTQTLSKVTQQKALTQTVLDFGQSLSPMTCPQCKMSYIPSVAEDTQLHDMYHNRHSQGIELGRAFLKSAMKWCYEVPHIPGSVVVVDRKISLPGRRVVQRVLEVVNKELGSVDIPEAELWSQKVLDGEEGLNDESAKKVDRYKVFLHVIDGKCVAVCLAERISKAHKVKKLEIDLERTPRQKEVQKTQDFDDKEDDGSNSLPTPTSASPNLSAITSLVDLELEEDTVDAIVGVSRIWTSKVHRRKGIASNLLDCVLSQFIYGMEIDKDEVAFSTPTELGTTLASGWHGESGIWAVYRET